MGNKEAKGPSTPQPGQLKQPGQITPQRQPGQITPVRQPGQLNPPPKSNPPQAAIKQFVPAKPTAQKETKVTFEDFKVLKVIGRGSFGTVYLVEKIDDKKIYAMKKLNKEDIAKRNEIEHTHAEKAVMANINSPFIAKLHYSFHDATNLYLIMDFINGGELFQHLCRESVFTEERTKFYAASLILALECLHSAGIIYRDLKPENVLLKADGNIVLVDFGQAKAGLKGDGARTSTICGTPAYFAPELLKGEPYTKSVDWWSLGTMIYEMLWGVGPFWCEAESDMYAQPVVAPSNITAQGAYSARFIQIMEGELIFDESWSPEVVDLLGKLIERDPTKRLSNSSEMKKHPWFADIDWRKLQTLRLAPPFKPEVSGGDDLSQINPDIIAENPDFDELLGEIKTNGPVSPRSGDEWAGFTFTPNNDNVE